jgi:hypothetical protein
MISNPVSLFSGGGSHKDIKEFIYEGGSKLYHFSPHDNNLSNTFENNLVFFADNEIHAKDVLKRMFKFAIECNNTQIEYHKTQYHQDYFDWRGDTTKRFQGYLDNLDKIKVPEAPINQFYIVGWASNDNIH